jgi:monoamine oxidase
MRKSSPVDTEVLIVGAGIAGLYAAYRLQTADIPYMVLEAHDTWGGRIRSRREKQSELGLTLDEGANLINSTDTLAIGLMNRFNISYVRRLTAGSQSMRYLHDHQLHDQDAFDRLLYRDSRTAINHIQHDQDVWRTEEGQDNNPAFINESIKSYLDRIHAGPVLRIMLKAFFWSEYGREIENLNLHVLFDYLEIDLEGPCFKLIPNVDEAYTVPGGTGQITDALARATRAHLYFGHWVSRIDDGDGLVRVTVTDTMGERKQLVAREIFFGAPLHSLSKIEVSVAGITNEELAQARAATYARGTKLHLKFKAGFEQVYDDRGILLTDTGEQIWMSSVGQGGAGLLTVLTGPVPEGEAATERAASQIVTMLDSIAPGLRKLYVGVERTDAPSSYSGSLRPGEKAHLTYHEGGPRWISIGEASSAELQGYLEGALRSAEDGVTRYLLEKRAAKRR